VTQAEQLQSLVDNSKIGQILKLKVRRGAQIKEVAVQTAQLQDF
jgi:S1-C subfamily serine protease